MTSNIEADMITIELDNEVEFISPEHRGECMKVVGCSPDDHKAKIVGEIRIDTHHEAELGLRSNRPDEFGYRSSLALIILTRRDLELMLSAMRSLEIEEARNRGI